MSADQNAPQKIQNVSAIDLRDIHARIFALEEQQRIADYNRILERLTRLEEQYKTRQ